MADRREELLEVIDNDPALIRMVEDAVFLEQQLDYLRTLPQIKVHPKDPTKQKSTAAARQYREKLQLYTTVIRNLERLSGAVEAEEDSPLRRWFSEHNLDAG